MLQNINAYDPLQFELNFRSSPIYKQLCSDFDHISFDYHWNDHDGGTPRQHHGDRSLRQTSFSAVPFYYIDFLLQDKPVNIYDLGCGWNIFKKYIPNVIGVSAEPKDSKWFYADIHDFVDQDYIHGHQQYFESMMSICALHVCPLSHIRQRVIDIGSMLQYNGKCFVSFNLQRLIENDNVLWNNKSMIETFVRQELDNLPYQVEVFDCDFDKVNNGMDGNIRIVMKRT